MSNCRNSFQQSLKIVQTNRKSCQNSREIDLNNQKSVQHSYVICQNNKKGISKKVAKNVKQMSNKYLGTFFCGFQENVLKIRKNKTKKCLLENVQKMSQKCPEAF